MKGETYSNLRDLRVIDTNLCFLPYLNPYYTICYHNITSSSSQGDLILIVKMLPTSNDLIFTVKMPTTSGDLILTV
jgi:hypothetical protein